MKLPLDKTKRLHDFITPNMQTEFVWGKWDCCLFACNCVHAITDIDPGYAFRDKYVTAKGAKKALKKIGKGTIEATFSHYFGPIKPRLNARQTDLVLLDTPLGDAVGIVCGIGVLCAGESGLVRMPLSTIKGCWHICDYIEHRTDEQIKEVN